VVLIVGQIGAFISEVQSWQKVLNLGVFFPSYITHFSDNPKEEFRTSSALNGV